MDETRLARYLELLLERNQVMNLTAAHTLEELRVRHLQDSLQLLDLPEVQAAGYALDVGTGGGFPGIPLAIARPDLQVTLIDATLKKVRAVQDFIEAIPVPNAVAMAGRAEELGRDPRWRQKFDLVVSRAFAPLAMLLEYTAPFCQPGGHLVAFKGPDADAELETSGEAMHQLGVRFNRTARYQMRDHTFNLLIFDVQGQIPSAFPRSHAEIRKKPLTGT